MQLSFQYVKYFCSGINIKNLKTNKVLNTGHQNKTIKTKLKDIKTRTSKQGLSSPSPWPPRMINTDRKHITNRPFTYTANLISSMYRYSFFKHRRGPGMEEADTVAALLSFAAITNCSTSIRWHSSETLCWPKQKPVVLACRRPGTTQILSAFSVSSTILENADNVKSGGQTMGEPSAAEMTHRYDSKLKTSLELFARLVYDCHAEQKDSFR